MKKIGIISGLVFEILFLIFWLTIAFLLYWFVITFELPVDYSPEDTRQDKIDFFSPASVLYWGFLFAIINSICGFCKLLKNKKINLLNKICFFIQIVPIIFWVKFLIKLFIK